MVHGTCPGQRTPSVFVPTVMGRPCSNTSSVWRHAARRRRESGRLISIWTVGPSNAWTCSCTASRTASRSCEGTAPTGNAEETSRQASVRLARRESIGMVGFLARKGDS